MTLSTPTTTIQPPSTASKEPSSDDDYPFYPTWMTKEEFNSFIAKRVEDSLRQPGIPFDEVCAQLRRRHASKI